MRFVRLSRGAAPVRQDGNRRAPERRGWWAFPWPQFEMFFAGHQYLDALPKHLSDGALTEMYAASASATQIEAFWDERATWIRGPGRAVVKFHELWHRGPVWSVLDKRGQVTHDWMSGNGHWNLLNLEEYARAVRRHRGRHGNYRQYYMAGQETDNGKTERWSGFVYQSNDYLEVFLPADQHESGRRGSGRRRK